MKNENNVKGYMKTLRIYMVFEILMKPSYELMDFRSLCWIVRVSMQSPSQQVSKDNAEDISMKCNYLEI